MQATFHELVGTAETAMSTAMLGALEQTQLFREVSGLTPGLEIARTRAMDAQASDTVITGSACQSIFRTCSGQAEIADNAICISDQGRGTAAEGGNGSDANPSNFPPYCIQ